MEVSKIKQFNVVMLGLSFMLLFTGFMTMAGIQTLVFNSAKNPDSGGKVIFKIRLGGGCLGDLLKWTNPFCARIFSQ